MDPGRARHVRRIYGCVAIGDCGAEGGTGRHKAGGRRDSGDVEKIIVTGAGGKRGQCVEEAVAVAVVPEFEQG